MDKKLDGYFILYKEFATAEGKSPRTIEDNLADVRGFAKFLGECTDITQIMAEDLRRYIRFLQIQPRYATHPTIKSRDRLLTADSIASYVRGIRSFWAWLLREGFITFNPFALVKPPKLIEKSGEPLSPGEFTRLLKVIPADGKNNRPDHSMVITLYGTGMRVSELVSLRLDGVNFETGQITVTGKGNKQRALFTSPVLFKALFHYRYKIRPKADIALFFVTQFGRPINRFYVEHKLHDYGIQANIGRRIFPHILRYSFAIEFLRNGGDPFTLQQILGHSSLDMTRHYVRMANTDVERSMKKFSPLEFLGKNK